MTYPSVLENWEKTIFQTDMKKQTNYKDGFLL